MVFPIFLSVVFVLRNQAASLESLLRDAGETLSGLASDYELIVIDNASEDDSSSVYKTLTAPDGLPNLQVYALTKEIDTDTAAFVGLENALGDYVAVVDPFADDLSFLSEMLEKATRGSDVVFANNHYKVPQGLAYRAAYAVFNRLYRYFHGIDLVNEAPRFCVLNRSIVNFILQHQQPAIAYRHLPATAGFSRTKLEYSAPVRGTQPKRLGESIDRGIRLLVSTTVLPMRIVTSLSLFGAAANIVYSLYVLVIAIYKTDVAAGWVSLSLQQSGMFFLISAVLFVLGEYMLHMASLSNEGPRYHIAREFVSARLTRQEKLNVEEAAPAKKPKRTTRSKSKVA